MTLIDKLESDGTEFAPTSFIELAVLLSRDTLARVIHLVKETFRFLVGRFCLEGFGIRGLDRHHQADGFCYGFRWKTHERIRRLTEDFTSHRGFRKTADLEALLVQLVNLVERTLSWSLHCCGSSQCVRDIEA